MFDAYNHFFNKIISLNKETHGILAFGTDGEEQLYKAMKFNFMQFTLDASTISGINVKIN